MSEDIIHQYTRKTAHPVGVRGRRQAEGVYECSCGRRFVARAATALEALSAADDKFTVHIRAVEFGRKQAARQ